MKVLLVSWFFPPSNTIGAVRLGNLARWLIARGHDVRVIAARKPPYPQTLVLDLPQDRVVYTRWIDVNAVPRALAVALKRGLAAVGASRTARSASKAAGGNPPGTAGGAQTTRGTGRPGRISVLITNVLNWPDSRVGWLPFALVQGRRVLARWRPDIVFASGPPFTTLLIGHFLGRWFRLPLVVEFRDRWHDDPYYPPPPWRMRIDRLAEARIVRRAVGITTVSEPWARTYRERYAKPVEVIYNGFDQDVGTTPSDTAPENGGPLRIVYTGGIYPGRRDPSPLFAALHRLGPDGQHVRVEFYGTDPSLVVPLAERQGVTDLVIVHPPIPHTEAVRQQRRADVLLLMQWNDPKEQGNVPGKFFEYLGALRPILILGLEDGVPATIVRERSAGLCINDPDRLAAQLKAWIDTKRKLGYIPTLPEEARRGFSRTEQCAKLESFLAEVVQTRAQGSLAAQPSA